MMRMKFLDMIMVFILMNMFKCRFLDIFKPAKHQFDEFDPNQRDKFEPGKVPKRLCKKKNDGSKDQMKATITAMKKAYEDSYESVSSTFVDKEILESTLLVRTSIMKEYFEKFQEAIESKANETESDKERCHHTFDHKEGYKCSKGKLCTFLRPIDLFRKFKLQCFTHLANQLKKTGKNKPKKEERKTDNHPFDTHKFIKSIDNVDTNLQLSVDWQKCDLSTKTHSDPLINVITIRVDDPEFVHDQKFSVLATVQFLLTSPNKTSYSGLTMTRTTSKLSKIHLDMFEQACSDKPTHTFMYTDTDKNMMLFFISRLLIFYLKQKEKNHSFQFYADKNGVKPQQLNFFALKDSNEKTRSFDFEYSTFEERFVKSEDGDFAEGIFNTRTQLYSTLNIADQDGDKTLKQIADATATDVVPKTGEENVLVVTAANGSLQSGYKMKFMPNRSDIVFGSIIYATLDKNAYFTSAIEAKEFENKDLNTIREMLERYQKEADEMDKGKSQQAEPQPSTSSAEATQNDAVASSSNSIGGSATEASASTGTEKTEEDITERYRLEIENLKAAKDRFFESNSNIIIDLIDDKYKNRVDSSLCLKYNTADVTNMRAYFYFYGFCIGEMTINDARRTFTKEGEKKFKINSVFSITTPTIIFKQGKCKSNIKETDYFVTTDGTSKTYKIRTINKEKDVKTEDSKNEKTGNDKGGKQGKKKGGKGKAAAEVDDTPAKDEANDVTDGIEKPNDDKDDENSIVKAININDIMAVEATKPINPSAAKEILVDVNMAIWTIEKLEMKLTVRTYKSHSCGMVDVDFVNPGKLQSLINKICDGSMYTVRPIPCITEFLDYQQKLILDTEDRKPYFWRAFKTEEGNKKSQIKEGKNDHLTKMHAIADLHNKAGLKIGKAEDKGDADLKRYTTKELTCHNYVYKFEAKKNDNDTFYVCVVFYDMINTYELMEKIVLNLLVQFALVRCFEYDGKPPIYSNKCKAAIDASSLKNQPRKINSEQVKYIVYDVYKKSREAEKTVATKMQEIQKNNTTKNSPKLDETTEQILTGKEKEDKEMLDNYNILLNFCLRAKFYIKTWISMKENAAVSQVNETGSGKCSLNCLAMIYTFIYDGMRQENDVNCDLQGSLTALLINILHNFDTQGRKLASELLYKPQYKIKLAYFGSDMGKATISKLYNEILASNRNSLETTFKTEQKYRFEAVKTEADETVSDNNGEPEQEGKKSSEEAKVTTL